MSGFTLELFGPCNEAEGFMPQVNDTIGVMRESGRITLMTVTKVEPSLGGMDIWTHTAERFHPVECYLLYSTERT